MGVEQTEKEEQEEVPADVVGRRVSCGGDRATVRYVGPVPPTAGLWFGVEWDDPGRGKHDGGHDGVQYFSCSRPTGGSFVRPANASLGVDFLSAVQQTYRIDLQEVLRDGSSEQLEWAGLEEGSLDRWTQVSLSHSDVNGAGADGQIRRNTPNVSLLDLSNSLLSCWEDVASITEQLEQLQQLLLCKNRLRLPSDVSAHLQAFCSLRILVLNSCSLTWPQVLQCAPMWPQLEELSVEENDITELQRPVGVLQSLKSLVLCRNALAPGAVSALDALPRLEQLNLSHTGLERLCFEDAAAGSETSSFVALTSLNLDHNSITEWAVVDELDKLPRLVKLCCRGNKLVSADGNPLTAAQMIIAKLGRLEVLNGCTIQRDVRKGAELDYIKMFGEEWLKAGGRGQVSSEFTCRHPRYLRLIDKHGAPEDGELRKSKPATLKNQLLTITLAFPDAAERTPITKKLPASMLVQNLKGLLHRLLKVPAADLRLSYSTDQSEAIEYELASDLNTLHFYSIKDGDQVLVRWS